MEKLVSMFGKETFTHPVKNPSNTNNPDEDKRLLLWKKNFESRGSLKNPPSLKTMTLS